MKLWAWFQFASQLYCYYAAAPPSHPNMESYSFCKLQKLDGAGRKTTLVKAVVEVTMASPIFLEQAAHWQVARRCFHWCLNRPRPYFWEKRSL